MAMEGCRLFLGPDRMMRAADYSDESDLVFTVYYHCMAGGRDRPCRTAILPKFRETLREDALARKQRRHCNICDVKYKTKFGLLLLVSIQGVAYYCYAQMPPAHLFESDGRTLGGRGLALMTRDSIYLVCQDFRPVAETPLVPTEHEGHFRITAHGEWLATAYFDWDQLYNPQKVLEVVHPAVAPSRVADGPAIEDSHP